MNEQIKHTAGPWQAGLTSDSVIAPNEPHGSIPNREYYGGFLIAETVSPRNRPLVIAAPDLLAAAIAQEEAEDYNANECPDCSDDGSTELPELCEHCFPYFDKARVLRRAAIAKAKGE